MSKKRKYKMTEAHKRALRAAHKKRRGKPRKKNPQQAINETISAIIAAPRRKPGRPSKNTLQAILQNPQTTGFSIRLNAAIIRLEAIADRFEKALSQL